MKKLALIIVIGMLLSLAVPFNSIVRAQDPAAADTLSIDDMDPVLYNPEEEAEEVEGCESSSTIIWIGVAIIVVVGGVLVFKKSSKKK